MYLELTGTWNGLGMDLEWTRNGLGMDKNFQVFLSVGICSDSAWDD